jgi:3-oxoadipate CoA-transferase alpha subunit
VPQGNLAERIRAAGAASARSSARPVTARCSPRARRRAEINGRQYVLEHPIHADVALIKADRGDRWGNLV